MIESEMMKAQYTDNMEFREEQNGDREGKQLYRKQLHMEDTDEDQLIFPILLNAI